MILGSRESSLILVGQDKLIVVEVLKGQSLLDLLVQNREEVYLVGHHRESLGD